MKVATLEEMQDIITKMWPHTFCKTSAEFYNNDSKGLWMTAEPGPSWEDGKPIFNYDSTFDDPKEETWIMGVHNRFEKILDEHGWFVEFYDPGTVMLFPQ